jgi:hypothetical protein
VTDDIISDFVESVVVVVGGLSVVDVMEVIVDILLDGVAIPVEVATCVFVEGAGGGLPERFGGVVL